jgi:hypothetical protein
MTDDQNLEKILSGFTLDGTPLPALVGNKLEWSVTILTAAMISNEHLAASMDPEEMVDAAINYANIIQDRLGYYQQSKVHALEKLL